MLDRQTAPGGGPEPPTGRAHIDNYVAGVEDVLGAGFGAGSLVAGFDSAAGFDSVAGLDSPPAAGAASLAGLSVAPEAALGA